MKEVLPVAARALGLTVQPWEVRDANGFERVFAALNKQRPDGLYVLPAGPLMRTNQKRTVGFALKSRLPSMYGTREDVDAGGLMSYGADLADRLPACSLVCQQDPEGCQARRSAGAAADAVRSSFSISRPRGRRWA